MYVEFGKSFNSSIGAICNSSSHGLEQFRIHLHCRILVDQAQRKNKPTAALLSHQGPLNALHKSALDVNLLADHQLALGFHLFSAQAGTEKIGFRVRKGHRLPAVADNLQNPGRL
jgi:hypothetical protein